MSDHSNGQLREEPQSARTFNPGNHLIQLKSRDGSKDYLPVQWRLVWFREQCPEGTIDTEEIMVDLDREVEEEAFVWNSEKRRSEKVMKHSKGYARFRAVVTDGKGGRATGTKSENAASFPDFIEKAETGAIGRALAALGYGTQFAPELDEAHRIVDSPVASNGTPHGNGSSNEMVVALNSNATLKANHGTMATNGNRPDESEVEGSLSDQQRASIRKLCEHLGKAEPEQVANLSFVAAKKVLQQLTAEYRESKQSSKAS